MVEINVLSGNTDRFKGDVRLTVSVDGERVAEYVARPAPSAEPLPPASYEWIDRLEKWVAGVSKGRDRRVYARLTEGWAEDARRLRGRSRVLSDGTVRYEYCTDASLKVFRTFVDDGLRWYLVPVRDGEEGCAGAPMTWDALRNRVRALHDPAEREMNRLTDTCLRRWLTVCPLSEDGAEDMIRTRGEFKAKVARARLYEKLDREADRLRVSNPELFATETASSEKRTG